MISREWKKGDQVVLNLPMPVRELMAHPEIKEDSGRVAIQRGPLVYCFEWPDNKEVKIPNIQLNNKNSYQTAFVPNLLNGITVIKTTGIDTGIKTGNTKQSITAIPYYSWANRGAGEMNVWMKVQK